jgi:hypothetical protein
METTRPPRDREQQLREQGYVDAAEHAEAEALKHAPQGPVTPATAGKKGD